MKKELILSSWNGKHLPDVQPTGCESLNIPGDDVNFNVCELTATTKCYLMAHVNPTPNLRKLDAKSSSTEDRNNGNVV